MSKVLSRTGVQKKAAPKGAPKKPTQSMTAEAVAPHAGVARPARAKLLIKLKKAKAPALKRPTVDVGIRTKTLRLKSYLDQGLELLRPMLGVSANEMINEAVGEYIERRTAVVETDLGGLLQQVRAYRRADPDFRFANSQVVAGELAMAGKDSTDGTLLRECSFPPTPVASRVRKHG